MICPLCNREIDEFMSVSVNDGQVEIKEQPPLLEKDRKKELVQRQKEIKKRADEIIQLVKKNTL